MATSGAADAARDRAGRAQRRARLAIVDGRWREEALVFERSFYLFDNDALEAARAAWRALGDGRRCRAPLLEAGRATVLAAKGLSKANPLTTCPSGSGSRLAKRPASG